MSVSVTLEDDIDISRGDLIIKKEDMPEVSREINCMMCWLNPVSPQPRTKYFLYHGTRELRGLIQEIPYKVDINTLEQITGETAVEMNDIFHVRLRLSEPLAFDRYSKNRNTGSLILVDPTTNETVAAGMIM
jgi:sulfate adenylyltransferase subunit 1